MKTSKDIFFVYEKPSGKFKGSGTRRYHNKYLGSTLVPFTAERKPFDAVFDEKKEKWKVTYPDTGS